MLIAERHSRLRQLIAERGMAGLEALSKELDVSPSTIRRDLAELEQLGVVKRTHGGAIWTGESSDSGRPYAFEQRLQYRTEAKRRMAAVARKLVQAGQTVLLDGGTTTYYLAEELLGTSLQLVTNSLPIASLYQNDEHVELILTGGVVYPRYGILLGPATEAMIGSIHAQTLFLSVAGLRASSLYNQNMLLVQAERKMLEQSQRSVLMIDSDKFGQQALVKLGELSSIDTLITDAAPPEDVRKEIERAGCELIVAG